MRYSLPFVLLLFSFSPVYSQFLLDSTVLDSTTVYSGLDIPWELKYGPDDHLWVTERYGAVRRIDPVTGQGNIILDISDEVMQVVESGLLGMEFHPNFADTPYLYIAYTYDTIPSAFLRLVRYEFNSNSLINPVILLDSIKANTNHNGCRLIVSPGRKLFMTTGDSKNSILSQNLQSLNGKVLRINLDGSIPQSNPISGSPVWSYGFRNAQGLAFGPNNKLYCSEHGPSANDEFQRVFKNKNYGWPDIHGYCDLPNEQPYCSNPSNVYPLHIWTPTIAPSDLIYYDHPAIPEFKGRFILTTLKAKKIITIKLDQFDLVTSVKDYLNHSLGRIRDICVAPDGRIFLALNGQSYSNVDPFTHKILELKRSNLSACDLIDQTQVEPLSYTSVKLQWSVSTSANSYLIRGKEINSGWVHLDAGSQLFYDVFNLQPHSYYVWQPGAICNNDTAYFKLDTFRISEMINCQQPGSIWTSDLTQTSVRLNWPQVDYANIYRIYGQEDGNSTIVKINVPAPGTHYNVYGLEPGTSYSWAVQAICNIKPLISSPLSQIDNFSTVMKSGTEGLSAGHSFFIYEVSGRLIASGKSGHGELNHVLIDLHQGIYIIKLHKEEGIRSFKYVKYQ